MNLKKILAAICATTLLCAGVAFAECPQFDVATYPVVDGSTATLPLSYALMQASTGVDQVTAENTVVHNQTTTSFYNLCYNSADLLLVYEPSADAYEAVEFNEVELEMAPIGIDALVFLINENNPVTSLTHEQIIDIYTGKATNWSDVGGNDQEIMAYQRNATSGSQVMMEAQVMQGIPMAEAPTSLLIGGMGELVDAVAAYRNTANAIGYSVFYYATNMYLQQGIRLLDVNGVTPTNETIASGEYPYTQAFYAVIRADEPEDSPARQLYNWLTTDEGRALIEEAGYVAMPADEVEEVTE